MILPRFLKLLAIVSLSLLILPAIFPVTPKEPVPVNLISYNPPPANNFHAPISDMGLIGITNATPAISTLTSVSAASPSSAISGPSIRQNALRFITDNSYFPQTETSIAVDPHNPNHILGGFNDQKFFFCGIIPNDCAGSFPASGTGFTTSADGGKTVAKSSDLPNVQLGQNLFISFGDPSVAPSTDGNFFFASLGFGAFGGNGILIAKSNSNLFNNTVSCETSIFNTTSNSCWSSIFVFGGTNAFFLTLEDKELLAVDNDPASPFYGSVYISWDHFSPNGTSASYMARCDNMLSSCVMLSGGGQLILSGNDFFPSFTTPVVDKQGNVHVAWCNYGTFGSLGPINCRKRTSRQEEPTLVLPMTSSASWETEQLFPTTQSLSAGQQNSSEPSAYPALQQT